MTRSHRHPHPARGHGFSGTLLASAALSGALTYLLFSPQPGNAGASAPRKPAALSQDVSVDAKLVKAESGWSIRLLATNPAATARQCQLTASLTRRQSSPMSRVPPVPRTVWTSAVSVTVPAHGESPARLAIPVSIAKDIPEPKPEPSPMDILGHFGVQVQATCGGSHDARVS
jgi:hypothetical protein